MKLIQTFWTANTPPTPKRSIDIKAGWPTCEYHWMSWALSCLQARSLFDEVELVTDHFGKEILIDILGLPYTNVSTALEGVLQDYPSQVWALAKIFSYSIQTEPFLHIDGDVFLWEKPGKRIMEAGIISQNLEKDLFFYKAGLDGINEVFTDLPLIYQKGYYENRPIYSANAGLIGGNDLEFFKIYCKEAFAFIDGNKKDLGKVNPDNLSMLNFLFEQYALVQIALRENKAISFYLEEVIETPVYKDLIRFQDRPSVKMIHPVGGFKKKWHVQDHLAKTLRSAYPSFYYKIVDWVRREGIPMTNKIYYSLSDSAQPFSDNTQPLSDNTQPLSKPFKAYERTLEAMALWNAGEDWSGALQRGEITQKECKDRIEKSLGERKEKELVMELIDLEYQKERVFEKTFAHCAGIAAAYKKEALLYENLQRIFSLSLPEILSLIIKVNEDALFLEFGWIWKYSDTVPIRPTLEKNLLEERSLNQVALVPSILRVNIDEQYLDQLDMIIVETVRGGVNTIAALMEETKQYFDADEMKTDPAGFEKLMIDTLKRLCYAGVLNIVFAEQAFYLKLG